MVKLVTSLCGKIDPLSIKDYKDNGGFKALETTLFKMNPQKIIDEIKESNLKGRGGAAFPTGLKLQFVSLEDSDTKYVICNADEGEPGTFKDKILLDGSPLQVIEGMIISAYTVGAHKGYIYIRGEYPKTRDLLKKAVNIIKEEGYLGENILESSFNFDIEVRTGTGAYICGEETALIESIEGKPARSRFKPPFTAKIGLWGKPTLVNNVETLANIPVILNIGAKEYKKYGTESGRGTKIISVSGGVVNKGVYEVEFGISIREIIDDICGGVEEGKKIKFVQIGGSSGAVIPENMLDIKLDFDELRKLDIGLGSGAIFVGDESACILDFMKATAGFFKHESCGKCTPCREGNHQMVKLVDKIIEGKGTEEDLNLINELALVMQEASLCGLGQLAPTALLSTMKYFSDEYKEHIEGKCRADVCSLNGEGK